MDGSLVLARAKGGRMGRWAFVFLSLLFPLSGFAQSGSLEERLSGLVEKIKPSIVKVKSEAGRPSPEGNAAAPHATLALGVAVDPSHVVTTADIEQLKYFSILATPESVLLSGSPKRNLQFTVQTADGRELDAELVATDRTSNLAVLAVKEGNLTPAPFGNAAALKAGSLVIVPASCLSKTFSASFGPVTEFRRDGSLLLDVSVFPGMVGAPVLNQEGEVIGMVTGQTGGTAALPALQKEREGGGQAVTGLPRPVDFPVSGQAIALPAAQLQKLASQMIQYRKVSRPFLGVYPQNLDDELKAYHKVGYGVLITELASGGPAELAGLKQGDVILSLNGQKMETDKQFRDFLSEKKPGDLLKVEVSRNHRKRTFSVTLADRADFEAAAPPSSPPPFRAPDVPKSLAPAYPPEGFLGISASDLTERQKARFKLDGGAYVEDVTEGSPAVQAGIRTGDIITAFNGKPIADADDLYRKIRQSEPGKMLPIEILHRGERRTLEVALAERREVSSPLGGNFSGPGRMRPFPFGENAGFLGVSTEELSGPAKESLNVEGGARVVEVTPRSPAEEAGLKEGDVITAVDGKRIDGPEDLSTTIGGRKAGEKVEITYFRKDAKRTAKTELAGRDDFERSFGGVPRMDLGNLPGLDARDRQIEKLQKQIEELRRALDSMRRGKE